MCDALTFLLNNTFILFGTKLYRQVVGIPMRSYCTPLVADLLLVCYERDFMISLSDDKQADIIDAFNTTSRYLDNVYFDNMVYLLDCFLLRYSVLCMVETITLLYLVFYILIYMFWEIIHG